MRKLDARLVAIAAEPIGRPCVKADDAQCIAPFPKTQTQGVSQ